VVPPEGNPPRVNAGLAFLSQKLDGAERLAFKSILTEKRFRWSRGVGKSSILILPLKGNPYDPYGNVQTEWNTSLQFPKIIRIC
jgi:hypothetical protein